MRLFSRGGRLLTAAALTGYGLLVAAILCSYFLKYPVPEFWAKAFACASAAWLAYALYAAGGSALWLAAWIAPMGWIPSLGPWHGRLLRTMVGFGFLGFSVVVLGWAVPGSLAIDLRVIFAVLMFLSVAAAVLRPVPLTRRPRMAPLLLIALPAAGAVASFLTSFSPITYYDSLVYHLALPAVYLRDGHIGNVAGNLYSAFPGGCEAVYTFILGVLPAPEYTINLLGWLMAFLLGAAVAEWAVQIDGRKAGWIAVTIWWTMPPVLLLCQGGYVDLPLAAATYLAVRSVWAWGADPDADSAPALAGFFGGLAISIKYTGAIPLFLVAGATVLLGRGRKGTGRALVAMAIAAAILPLPWLIKNALSLGNPVFPFFYHQLGGRSGWTADSAGGYFSVLTEYSGRSNLLVDLLTPWKEASTRGGFDVLGDFGWPMLLLAALPAAFLSARREVRYLALYFVAHAVAWYFSKPVLRFLVPAMPIAVLLAAVTLARVGLGGVSIQAAVATLLTVGWWVSNVFLYGLAAGELKAFAVPFGETDARTFLERRLSFYPAFEYLNEKAARETVLVVGEQRTYHLRTPFIASNIFAPSPVADVCNRALSLNDVSRFLYDRSVTRVLMSEGEISRLGGLGKFGFSPAGETMFRNFLALRTRPELKDRGVVLYALLR